jgi:hypothetical protein
MSVREDEESMSRRATISNKVRRSRHGRLFSSIRGRRELTTLERACADRKVDCREIQTPQVIQPVRPFLPNGVRLVAHLRADDDDNDSWIHTLQKIKLDTFTMAQFALPNTYREEKHADVDDVRSGTRKDGERTQQVKRLQRKNAN